jgi:hypothetical protein
MSHLLRISILLATCFLATPALFAQEDYAGSCTDCANCQIRDPSGNWWYGLTCGGWSGYVPDCSTWDCRDGCRGTSPSAASCQRSEDGLYHYFIVYRVENLSHSDMKLVSAVITTSKGTRSVLVKRAS